MSLASYWELRETSGTNANDSHGANDGTHAGSPGLAQPGALRCAIAKSVAYDGLDDTTASAGVDLSGTNAASLTGFLYIAGYDSEDVDVQIITVTNATGGTFTVSIDGVVSPTSVAFDATADEVLAALTAVSGKDAPSNVTGGGPWYAETPGGPWTVAFDDPALVVTANGAGLTGGGAAVVITTDTIGEANRMAIEYGDMVNGGFRMKQNDSSQTFRVGFGAGGAAKLQHGYNRASIPSYQWHPFSLVIDKDVTPTSERIKFKVDDVLLTPTSIPSNLADTTNFANDTLHLMSHLGSSQFGRGMLAEIALWDHALTDDEQTEIWLNR